MNLISNEECLAHHGIKGQRWGVRRYQNEDGSRTEVGRRRRSEIASVVKKLQAKKRTEEMRFAAHIKSRIRDLKSKLKICCGR